MKRKYNLKSAAYSALLYFAVSLIIDYLFSNAETKATVITAGAFLQRTVSAIIFGGFFEFFMRPKEVTRISNNKE